MVDTTGKTLDSPIVDEPKGNFVIHNIYTKDVSYESPNSPQIFSMRWAPRIDFDLQMHSQRLNEDLWEVTLDVTVKVGVLVDADKITDDSQLTQAAAQADDSKIIVAFLVEVKQAGVFTLANMSDAKKSQLLATGIPAILFPYVREQVANLIVKGGFPVLNLPPMDFDAMYQQHLSEKQLEQQAQAAEQKANININNPGTKKGSTAETDNTKTAR